MLEYTTCNIWSISLYVNKVQINASREDNASLYY
jgi:hypothetical protein